MPKPRIIRTYLSRAPQKGAGVVAWLFAGLAGAVSWISWNDSFGLNRYLSAERAQVYAQHEFWRLFTSPWVHAGPDHLLDNLPFLIGLAFLVSGYFGLVAVPALALLAGAVIEAITLYFYPDNVAVVGASGIVYFLGGLWLMMVFLIESPRQSVLQRTVSCVGIALAVLAPHAYEAHVSYAAHAIGFALGPVAALAIYPGMRSRIRAAEVWQWPEPDEADELAELDPASSA